MVHIQNEGHELGGAIMFPEGSKKKLPVVLIIQGSGPTDKDGNSAALEGKNKQQYIEYTNEQKRINEKSDCNIELN